MSGFFRDASTPLEWFSAAVELLSSRGDDWFMLDPL